MKHCVRATVLFLFFSVTTVEAGEYTLRWRFERPGSLFVIERAVVTTRSKCAVGAPFFPIAVVSGKTQEWTDYGLEQEITYCYRVCSVTKEVIECSQPTVGTQVPES